TSAARVLRQRRHPPPPPVDAAPRTGVCKGAGMVATGPSQHRPVRVLVVEDEPAIATQIAHRLSAEGWEVETAGDGPSGVAKARAFVPDLVVLDVMLPGLDGLEVCRRIQAE